MKAPWPAILTRYGARIPGTMAMPLLTTTVATGLEGRQTHPSDRLIAACGVSCIARGYVSCFGFRILHWVQNQDETGFIGTFDRR